MYKQITKKQTPLSNNTIETSTQKSNLDSSEVYVAYKEGDVVALVAYLHVREKETWQGQPLNSDWYVYKKIWMNDVIKKKDWEDNYDVLKKLTPELMGDIDTLVESYPVTADPKTSVTFHDKIFSKVLFDKIHDKLQIICDRRTQNTNDTYGLKTSHCVVRNFINITGDNKLSVQDLIRFFKNFDNSIEQDGYCKGLFTNWYGYKPIDLKIEIGWRYFNEFANYIKEMRKQNEENDVNRNWDESLERQAAKSYINKIVLLIDLLVQLGIPINNIPINELENYMVNMMIYPNDLHHNSKMNLKYMKKHITESFSCFKEQGSTSPIKRLIHWEVQRMKISVGEKNKKKEDIIMKKMKNTLLADI